MSGQATSFFEVATFLVVPFIAGLLVLATHVPLGRLVLERGIVFVDLAVAQVAGLGALLAVWLGWENAITLQAMALAAALTAAALLTLTERLFGGLQEAVIGVLFVGTASLELVLMAFDAHGADHLRDLLVGQILWVEPIQLWPLAALAVIVLALMRWTQVLDRRAAFYGLFAVCITASVQVVGVYLVFASLIAPALGSRAYAKARALAAGYATGALGYAAGFVVSALTDLPTGPVIVLTLVAAALGGAAAGRAIRVQ
jgi:zinc/manganese transport system permease protein